MEFKYHPTTAITLIENFKISFQKFVSQTIIHLISSGVFILDYKIDNSSSLSEKKIFIMIGTELENYETMFFESAFINAVLSKSSGCIELKELIHKILITKHDKWWWELHSSESISQLVSPTGAINENGELDRRNLLEFLYKNRIDNSSFFSLFDLNRTVSIDYEVVDLDNLFIITSNFQEVSFENIDSIYTTAINTYSDSNFNKSKSDKRSKWGNYNAGSTGQAH